MLKIWAIFYLAGKVVFTAGPLPISFKECVRRATPTTLQIPMQGTIEETARIVCVKSRFRPAQLRMAMR